jgi:hypothetical protein
MPWRIRAMPSSFSPSTVGSQAAKGVAQPTSLIADYDLPMIGRELGQGSAQHLAAAEAVHLSPHPRSLSRALRYDAVRRASVFA